MKVSILKYWSYPNILRQTPGGKGVWNGISFEVDKNCPSDYVIVHGHIATPRWIKCPKGNVWLVMGEPPDERNERLYSPPVWVDRLYVTDERLVKGKQVFGTAYLPWWVNKSFDELIGMQPLEKNAHLSWITSNITCTEGHRLRMSFLEKIRGMKELDLFGRGLRPVADKWEALAPYRYSISFENFSNSGYFSEKVMDCFLAWTMPIYFGCTNLEKFFPAESFVRLDPNWEDPIGELRRIIDSDRRERNMNAISEARHRVLYDFNLFNLIAEEVAIAESQDPSSNKQKKSKLIWNHTTGWRQLKPKFLNGTMDRLREAASRFRIQKK